MINPIKDLICFIFLFYSFYKKANKLTKLIIFLRMQYILFEIYYRSVYIVTVVFFIECFSYFTQGFQLEFFSSVFVTNNQAVDFNFYNNIINYLEKSELTVHQTYFTNYLPRPLVSLQLCWDNYFFSNFVRNGEWEREYLLINALFSNYILLIKNFKNFFIENYLNWYDICIINEINKVMDNMDCNYWQINNKDSLDCNSRQRLYEEHDSIFQSNLNNEAKTWSSLFIPGLNYFYCVQLQKPTLCNLLFYVKLLYFIPFVIMHIYSMTIPGMLNKQKHQFVLFLIWLLFFISIANSYTIVMLISFYEEYQLEQLDSELL